MKEIQLLLVATVIFACCRQQDRSAPVVTSANYNRGLSYLNHRNDSAYYYLNKVAATSKDSLQIAMAYNVMAYIESNEGDYYGGQETLLTSLKYLHEGQRRDQGCFVSDYNLLGSINLNLKNYDAAITYYDRALAWITDTGYKAIALNNKALAYEKKGQHPQAIAIFGSILGDSKHSKKTYPMVVTNLAMARWHQDSLYRAAPDLLKALSLRLAGGDDWGLNSSYAHLTDFYLHSRPDSALLYAQKMYAIASWLQSPDDRLEALQKLILLSPASELRRFFVQYQFLNDSLQTARNGAKNQFALIRYETEKNKAENFRLQRENAEKNLKIFWQEGSIVVFLLLVVWLYFWYQRLTRNRLRDRELQLSKKVHDEVANGIYHVMAAVQYQTIDQDQLVDDLEDLYEKSRNISYDEEEEKSQDMYTVVAKMVTSFGGPVVRTGLAGNDPELWEGVGDRQKRGLFIVLREIMVNMEKHSGATNVAVRFERSGGQLVVRYVDNGVGLPQNLRFGNGLKNTENRIKSLGGHLTFGRNSPQGLKIEIYLPIV